ncbi:RNA polymerase factor sigma-54 [Chlorobium sp. N1]|uniref:RNA polymerase factor sigma-54 n=1 Tax=Chlorobium sp. N1 TaxID=2491138 RepID=UPI00103AAE2E|nr:RNA polymerase factor sigma-54 [Chlorobium sp. N1]TCD48389.1 RNA polymerase sigma-54 factor [Chlorobium sp. N1]
MPEFRLQQKQKALLSVQQILGSQLLQLPLVNLEQRINEELQENPLLEAVEGARDSVSELPADSSSGEMFDELDRFSKSSLKEQERQASREERRESMPSFSYEKGGGEHFFQAVQHDSFHETLLRQLTLQEDVGREEIQVAIEILGNLDEDGYFSEDPSVIVDGLRLGGLDEVEEQDVENMRRMILRLDPPGVAALDLRERLLTQLELSLREHPAADAEAARDILLNHYEDFIHRRFERLLKKLELPRARLEAAVAIITGLDPHPGVFVDEGGHYISPDFVVTYENGALSASLNDRSALSVRVSDEYRDLLKTRKGSKDDRQFIRRNLQKANEFKSALETRRQTLLKVIESLMKHQYRFFTDGPSFLQPLGMKTLAADTGLDISTISRAVNGKYVQTRFGVFELKYFFSGALQTDEGEDVSSKIIKQHLREMIEAEDGRKPLSDDSLAAALASKGFQIARRTVAKYREQLQIPVARLRKKIF